MEYNAEELRNVAKINKSNLRKKSVRIPINGKDYLFKIAGVGDMSIKLEQYFFYSQIINSVQEGNHDGLEFLIEQIIIDPKKEKIPTLDSSTELRERAFANKHALKTMFIDVVVGTGEYEFRIAGIGGKSVKLELYVGYEDMAKVLNSGNTLNLEFILKEILVGNDVDYSIFNDIPDVKEDDKGIEEKSVEEIIHIDKLNSDESAEIISNITGVQKLVFDAIDNMDSDVFAVADVLEQDLIKSYAVQGKSFEPIIIKNINEFIDLGIIMTQDNEYYYKLW